MLSSKIVCLNLRSKNVAYRNILLFSKFPRHYLIPSSSVEMNTFILYSHNAHLFCISSYTFCSPFDRIITYKQETYFSPLNVAVMVSKRFKHSTASLHCFHSAVVSRDISSCFTIHKHYRCFNSIF